jgi:hypothetical protein
MTIEHDLRYGYKTATGTGLSYELLASTADLQIISITIDSSAVDSNSPVTTNLRRGLMMWPDPTVGDRYTEFDAAAATATASNEAVILAEDVPNIDNGNAVAKAYYSATFKNGVIFDDSGTTLTHWTAGECQRIKIRDNA